MNKYLVEAMMDAENDALHAARMRERQRANGRRNEDHRDD